MNGISAIASSNRTNGVTMRTCGSMGRGLYWLRVWLTTSKSRQLPERQLPVPHSHIERLFAFRARLRLDAAPGILQNQLTGCDVPEFDAVFDVRVVPAAR